MRRAIAAAAEAGVGLVAYASFINTGTSTFRLGEEHKQTEQERRSSGLPHVLLRNGAYTEMYTGTLGPALAQGAIIGSYGDGQISGAVRADLAAAAATVLTSDDQAGQVYELGGTAFTMTALAAEVSQQTRHTITYQDLPVDLYTKVLTSAGLPEAFAGLLADTSLAATRGDWYTDSTDLRELIGRPATSPAAAVTDALRAGLSRTLDPRG
ncbi:Rossmann-fold NAD(P)-binding domain-containing protein [Streptomyces sasae]|uniref:hypothetical protein n=1 Tax=Streptomyces sasae TaxID=1266772 RepID=UPI00292F6299|nr:hypothetical protein [Streptomyces sasae]